VKKVFFKTFGCRTNIYDTQIMIANLKDFIVVQSESEADIIVINSCTVTNSADSNVRAYVNSIKKLNKKIYFTGCGVLTKGESLFKEKKIDAVFGASLKENINELLQKDNFFEVGDLNHLDKTIITKMEGKTKAFVKIQEGCDFSCSYCIIPAVRGAARSYDEDLIIEQIKILASNGFGEFVLTGTNLGSYGKEISKNYKEKGDKLAKLLKKISKIRGVRRIRLGSVEPVQITEEFKEILKEPWMAKHLHIALQHTSPKMLKIMNRRNKLESDLELFNEIAEYGFAIGTDFIVGHPGEDEEIFNEAYKNLKKFPLTHIHLFTYSKRDGTKSALMKNSVRGDIAKKRLNLIKKLVDEKNYNFRKRLKKTLQILVEQKKDGFFIGYDEYFNKNKIKSELDLENSWVEISDFEVLNECNLAKI